ncbi:MAG TPA: CSLREA domain-containing protein [Roseiflexaceae bacterium]|nr:CSLREA domain-containing protein [Roseiflexaceae bacterium]
MERVRRAIITLALALLALAPAAAPRAQAQGPALLVTAPAQVAAGARLTLTLTLQHAVDLGGYEATLRFDTTAAHFNGMEQDLAALRAIGRDVEPLGPVEQANGIAFGAYSCPVARCVGARDGPRQPHGGAGTIVLAAIDLIADRPGTLELSLAHASFVDAAGNPVVATGANQTIRVQVGDRGAGPLYPAPVGPAAVGGVAGAPGPFDLTGDRVITHADLIEAALAWTVARGSDNPCGAAAELARDVNHDGCVDVADAQLIAAHYSPSGAPAGPGLAGLGATFTVDSAADADDAQPGDGVCATAGGACTLRAAITEANLAGGANTIAFAIPGGGVQTIALAAPLPTLSDESGPTTIDGYSQPGAQPNSDPLIDNATIRIQLTITNVITPSAIEALHVTSPGNTIRGLAIFGFRRSIFVFGAAATNNVIAGNFIGTDAAATYAAPAVVPSGNGVELSQGAAQNRIGGGTPAERNVISGNPKNGVATFNGGTNNNVIAGNLIGLAPDGRGRLHNLSHGVDINNHSSNNIIGGSSAAERNVVSGNDAEGVEISHGQATTGNQVLGNYIGTDIGGAIATPATRNGWHGVHIEDGPTGTLVAGNVIGNNGLGGVSIDGFETGFYPVGNQVTANRIGVAIDGKPIPNAHFGVQAADHSYQSKIGPDNIIAYNPIGVQITGVDTDFNTITRNSIYANAGLGIDLDPIGSVNPNDPGDADSGANEQLNAPLLVSATPYLVRGTACVTCTVEVFRASSGGGAYGQGQTFVGSASAGPDGTFAVVVSGIAVGDYVTATATDALGDTSEFALNLRAVAGPPLKRVYLAIARRG